MDAFGMLKFWRLRKAAIGTDDDEETEDGEETFFDLVFKSPDCASNKDFQFTEPSRDVSTSKSYLWNSKPSSPVTPLQSTSKSRAFVLGLSKSSKCEKTESISELKLSPLNNQISKSSKIEERIRFANEISDQDQISSERTSRDPVQNKYLKLIKPLYVSKQRNDKAQFTERSTTSFSPAMASSGNSGNRSFKMAKKQLQKSRSASAATDMAAPPARRRDDSLLEQDDGIKGAILHCKKSYTSSE